MPVLEKQITKVKPTSFTDLLGGKDLIGAPLSSGFDLISLSHKGVSKASLEILITHTGISKKDFIENILNLSVKTIERKESKDKLDRRTSSHILEITKVIEHAYAIFEEVEKVKKWLITSNRALNDLKPIALFDMPTGLQLVDQVLGRIEEGVYS